MKKSTLVLILFLLGGALFLGGCYPDNDYPAPQPQQPIGYQYEFHEDFNSDDLGWTFDFPQDSAYAFVDDGLYHFIDYSYTGGYNTAVVSTDAPTNRDFLIQTRFTSDYGMALVFGASPNAFGYSFFVDNEGYFALYNEGGPNSGLQTILDWQFSNAINQGTFNDVEIEQIGNSWVGYINGQIVFDIPAQYLGGDEAGFMVLPGTYGQADYLTAQW